MMGRLKSDQVNCSTSFVLAMPSRRSHGAEDRYCSRSALAPQRTCAPLFVHGRPSIDPELMIRMLVVGYVLAIRSERLICREVQLNLACRWFCKLGIEDALPDHPAFSRARNGVFREGDAFRRMFERVVETCIMAGLAGGIGLDQDRNHGKAFATSQTSHNARLHDPFEHPAESITFTKTPVRARENAG